MENQLKLYMVMLGCKPKGRVIEQHDIFFGIGSSIKNLIPAMIAFWPEAEGKLHIDAWREITSIDGHEIEITGKENSSKNRLSLFFINLGGYRPNEFEEYHYKVLSVANSLAEAQKKSQETAFYKHFGFKGAVSHIDDKYGIDVDDIHKVADILPNESKEKYSISISKGLKHDDELHIGYLNLSKL